LRKSRLKEKVDAGRTDDGRRTLRHGISSHGLWPGELINYTSKLISAKMSHVLCKRISENEFLEICSVIQSMRISYETKRGKWLRITF